MSVVFEERGRVNDHILPSHEPPHSTLLSPEPIPNQEELLQILTHLHDLVHEIAGMYEGCNEQSHNKLMVE
jgi:hypothetical protein